MTKCVICSHPNIDAIDQDIEDGLTHTAISRKYNITLQNIANHKRHMKRNLNEQVNILLNTAIEKQDATGAVRLLEYIERHTPNINPEVCKNCPKTQELINEALRRYVQECRGDEVDMTPTMLSKTEHEVIMKWRMENGVKT